MDDRPPPSPQKLLRQFRDWMEETELPGRTMSNLKTGSLPEVMAALPQGSELSVMTDAWQGWEKGETGPAAVLEVLRANDLEAMLAGLTSTE